MKDKTVVFVDYDELVRAYNLVVSPTIMVLDGKGIIRHIQYEYSPFFDHELMGQITDMKFDQ